MRNLIIALLFTTICLGQDYNLDTSLTDYGTPPALNKPNYLQSVTDPLFGTKITRITGDVGTTIQNTGGEVWRNVARHGYNTRQPWNADESIIYLNVNKTLNGNWSSSLFLDGETYEVISTSNNIPSANEQRWHSLDPDIMLLLRDDGIYAWSYSNNTTTQLYNLTGYSNTSLGYTGNWNILGNILAMSATRNSDGKQVAFAINTDTQTKSVDVDLSGVSVDYVTTSPRGDYIVVNAVFNGNNDTTKIFDWNGNQVGPYWSSYGRPSHYDVAIYQGLQYAVGVSKSTPDDGRIIARRLDNGDVTVLTQGGYGSHSSSRQIDRKGWVFSYNSSWTPYNDEIVASKIDGTRVERLVSVRSSYNVYDNEAQPVVSPKGTRVMYASDWNSGSTPIQGYVVDFRDNTFPLSNGESNINEIRLYPNPTTGELNINLQEDYKVRVFDISGKLLGNQLNLYNFAPGMYFVEISTLKSRKTIKVIKK